MKKVLKPNFFSELVLKENKIPQNPSPIIQILNISSDSEPKVNLSEFKWFYPW